MVRQKFAGLSHPPTLGAYGLHCDLLAFISLCVPAAVAGAGAYEPFLPASFAFVVAGAALHFLAQSRREQVSHDFEWIPQYADARLDQSRFMHPLRASAEDRRDIFNGLLRIHEIVVAARSQIRLEAPAIIVSAWILAALFVLLFAASAAFAANLIAAPTAAFAPTASIALTSALSLWCAVRLLVRTPASVETLQRLFEEPDIPGRVSNYHAEETSERQVEDRAKLRLADMAQAALPSFGAFVRRDRAERDEIARKMLNDADPRFALKPPVAPRR